MAPPLQSFVSTSAFFGLVSYLSIMRFQHTEYEPLSPSELIRSMSNSNLARYMQAQYFPPSHIPNNAHILPPMPREDNAQRKRPKYTRSKTGCLTCRAKKIKCDESKPTCIRCTHGQRDCTWPQTVPVASDSTSQTTADDFDGLPSTAECSGISDASLHPTRNHTPPIGHHLHSSLPALALRRQSEPYLHINQVPHQPTRGRRQSVADFDPTSTVQDQSMHQSNLNPGPMSMIPGIASYPSRSRYENNYPNTIHPLAHPVPRRGTSKTQRVGDRFMPHPASGTQWDSPIMPSLDPIDPFFQNAQERNLIRHYCNNSLSIIMAVPSENPIVAANLTLVLSKPRGTDSPTEALRSALLAVAAIHQSFLLAQGGATPEGADEMMQIAQRFRMTSKLHLTKACSAAEGTRSDASLAAALAIMLLDIFSGGQHWSKDMELAKNLVRLRGGPTLLLARSTPATPGLVEGISRNRLFLDILAVYDMAGCLVSGNTPMLSDARENSWWLNDLYASYSWVESVFGLSRSFLALQARVCFFLSRVARTRTGEITEEARTDLNNLKECRELYNSLESWRQGIPGLPARVYSGNVIYAKASQILLLRDVFGLDPTDSMVQQCVQTILNLSLQCTAIKMGVDLIWPVIIAGSHTYGTDRTMVTEVFEAFRTQCCYEIDTSENIVQHVWKRRDQGHLRPEWRHVMEDFGLQPLLV